MPKKKIVVRSRKRPTPQKCYLCERGFNPCYKDIAAVATLLSPRGKIVSRRRTGVCAKHQRKLALAVKRARIMAMA
ncbi:MAG: 30S ribosomal protein S18 [Candidatus Cloacimonetes bacterium]|nr:30S ribosomal protein S18 [Candidatus Cloacimonadota bacterium]